MTYFNIKTKSDLVNLKRKVQKQFMDQKLDDHNVYQENVKRLKPLLEPLKEIATNKSQIVHPLIIEKKSDPLIIEDANLIQLGDLSDRYLKKLNLRDYDHAYGIKPIEGSSYFRLGRKDVKINGNDLFIDGEQYKGTEGLWKLLTLKNPGNVSDNDMSTYEKMMLDTKAFLLDNDKIRANKGNKYKTIIKPIFHKYTQKPIEELINSPVMMRRVARTRTENITGTGIFSNEVIIPSDINELVERHQVLFSEMHAGNTNIFNELQAINDQLLKKDVFNRDVIEQINDYLLFYNKK
jgi:hypothetical protein